MFIDQRVFSQGKRLSFVEHMDGVYPFYLGGGETEFIACGHVPFGVVENTVLDGALPCLF